MRPTRHTITQALTRWDSRKVLVLLAPICTLAVLLPNAWVAEDAFISLRAAKNLLLGYGPNWNVGERVDVFTHPLWMGLLTVAQWLAPKHISQAVIGLGLVCTLAAVVLFMRDVKSRRVIVFATLVLLSSKAFIDYSTSGLENPLLYILVILFAHEFLSKQRPFQLSLLASLAAVTRADSVALFVPALAAVAWAHRRERKFWLDVLKGAIPLLAWEAFSLFYYGLPLPNTVYAKLHTYLPEGLTNQQATNYFTNSFAWDKITLTVIILMLVISDLERRNSRQLLLAAGIVAYLLLVIKAGGDYMSGRFFAVPFFLALYLLALWLQARSRRPTFVKPVMVAVLLAVAIIAPRSPIVHPLISRTGTSTLFDSHRGYISDEAAYYCPETCLYHLGTRSILFAESKGPGDHAMAYFVNNADAMKNKSVAVAGTIGMTGYVLDPQKPHIVDQFALADPLLSHLSADPTSRVGHFKRTIPDGYLASLEQHSNMLTEPCTARLYNDIRPVVTGPLISIHRFKDILKLNLGISDKLYVQCVRRNGK